MITLSDICEKNITVIALLALGAITYFLFGLKVLVVVIILIVVIWYTKLYKKSKINQKFLSNDRNKFKMNQEILSSDENIVFVNIQDILDFLQIKYKDYFNIILHNEIIFNYLNAQQNVEIKSIEDLISFIQCMQENITNLYPCISRILVQAYNDLISIIETKNLVAPVDHIDEIKINKPISLKDYLLYLKIKHKNNSRLITDNATIMQYITSDLNKSIVSFKDLMPYLKFTIDTLNLSLIESFILKNMYVAYLELLKILQ